MNIKEQLLEIMNSGQLELGSTHQNLSLPIIERIYKKMKLNLSFGSIQVVDGIIINGHHRYLASKLANFPLDQVPGSKSIAKELYDWKNVLLEDDDWDTEQELNHWNELDAKYNNISLEELLVLLDSIA